MQKHIMWYIKIFSLTLFVFIFLQDSHASVSFSSEDLWEYTKIITYDIDKTFLEKDQEDRNLQIIMKRLCINLMSDNLSQVNFNLSETEKTTYSAKESVFVAIACNSILSEKDNKKAKNDKFIVNNLLKQQNIRSLWLACVSEAWTTESSNTNCEKWERNNATDYPFIFYNLISPILNDISNLTMSRIYGVINSESKNKDLVNAYAINYFNIPLLFPEKKSYPQTYKKLEEYITLWKNLQNSTIILKTKDIDPSVLVGLDTWKNFLFYDSSQNEGLNKSIDSLAKYQWVSIDRMYNELFFYTLFIQTYSTYLEKFWSDQNTLPQVLKNQNKSINMSGSIAIQRERISSQNKSLQSAVKKTIRQLNNTISAFPIHIGMLMYQEDLLTMRNNLAKIYLPLHQLHYKLENVQSKE